VTGLGFSAGRRVTNGPAQPAPNGQQSADASHSPLLRYYSRKPLNHNGLTLTASDGACSNRPRQLKLRHHVADVCLKCGSDLRIAGTKADGSLLCRDRLLDRPGNGFAISASRDWVHPIATGGEYLLVLQDSLFKPLLRSQHPHDPNIASYYWAVGSANLVSGRLDDAAILLGKARAANADCSLHIFGLRHRSLSSAISTRQGRRWRTRLR
jgi:hypothetical protein